MTVISHQASFVVAGQPKMAYLSCPAIRVATSTGEDAAQFVGVISDDRVQCCAAPGADCLDPASAVALDGVEREVGEGGAEAIQPTTEWCWQVRFHFVLPAAGVSTGCVC
jgi:hypothetical protein